MISESLWNYRIDEVNEYANEIDAADNDSENNEKITTRTYFEYKTKIRGGTRAYNNTLDKEVVVRIKYLNNFPRSLDFCLINCEVERDLPWSRKFLVSEIYKTLEAPANPAANTSTEHVPPTLTFDATFQIKSTKLYVPVVTLPINDHIKFLENLKRGFKGTVSWNKCKSEITMQPKNNSLDYMIDPTFRNRNRLFVISFKNDVNDPTRPSFDNTYQKKVL